MKKELAKKLKDAGFKQTGTGFLGATTNGYGSTINAYIPTLSELIKACGDGFLNLYRSYGGGMAGSNKDATHFGASGNDGIIYTGLTPEEAVANLWLELNKK